MRLPIGGEGGGDGGSHRDAGADVHGGWVWEGEGDVVCFPFLLWRMLGK